jgi:hypothetical protein
MLLKMPPWSYHTIRLSVVWVAEVLLGFALIGKAFFVFCTCGVSRWALPWCSSPFCELRWSILGGGRPMVASMTVVLSRQLRWLLVRPCLAEHRSDNISRAALRQPHHSL